MMNIAADQKSFRFLMTKTASSHEAMRAGRPDGWLYGTLDDESPFSR
jgi:hypothetical protein